MTEEEKDLKHEIEFLNENIVRIEEIIKERDWSEPAFDELNIAIQNLKAELTTRKVNFYDEYILKRGNQE